MDQARLNELERIARAAPTAVPLPKSPAGKAAYDYLLARATVLELIQAYRRAMGWEAPP